MKRLKLFSMLLLLLIGVGQMWGDQVSFAWSGSQNSTTKAITWSSDICTMVQEQNGAQTAPNGSYISAPRWYSGNKITITAGSGVSTFTSIVITATTEAYATTLANSTYARTGGTGSVSAAASGTSVTITCTGTVTAFTIVLGGQSRLSGTTTPTINYTSSSGSQEPTGFLNQVFFLSSYISQLMVISKASRRRVEGNSYPTTPYIYKYISREVEFSK